jgi:hypothetical protein
MSNESERDHVFLRLGGIAALIGGIGGLVTNAPANVWWVTRLYLEPSQDQLR